MEDDGYNLVRTVRARDAERGRDLRARAGSRRVRQDRRSSATETPRRCAVGQARRLVLRAERGSAGALRPMSQSRFGCRAPHRARRLGGVGRRRFSARPRSIPGWPSHRDAPEPDVVFHRR